MKSGKTVSVVTKWREAYVVTWRSWIRADGGTKLFGLSRFGHATFRSDYEILQKSYFNAKLSGLIQSALPPSS